MAGLYGFGIASEIAMKAADNYLGQSREQYAREQNYALNEKAAQNADARTRALYKDLYSPSAQIKQLKDAGLSPSLMYGGGAEGVAGHAGAEGAGVSGISPTIFGMTPLEAAQVDLTREQADKVKEETKTEKGENVRGQLELLNMLTDLDNKQAETAYKNSLTEGQNILNYINENSKECQIQTLCSMAEKAKNEAKKAYEEMKQSKIKTNIDENTQEAIIENIKLRNSMLISEMLVNKSNVELNEEKKKEIRNNIEVSLQNLLIAWSNYENDYENKETRKKELKEKIREFDKMYTNYVKQLKLNEEEQAYKYGETIIERSGIENKSINNVTTKTTHKKKGEEKPGFLESLLNAIFE